MQWLSTAAAAAVFSAFPALGATVSVDYATVVHTLRADFTGVNYNGRWDPIQGDAGSRAALKRAQLQLLRFPGGVEANMYDWGWSLTHQDQTNFVLTSTPAIGAYADSIGAHLIMNTNFHASADSQGLWVSYCKTNTIPVALWEVGNEPELETATLISTAADVTAGKLDPYFTSYNAQAAAIKAQDPTATVMGPCACNTYYWATCGILSRFMTLCGSHADAVSLHWYKTGGANYADLARWNFVRPAAEDWNTDFSKATAAAQGKPIYITEWNVLGPGDADAAGDFSKTVGLALANIDMVGAMAKSGVAGQSFFGGIHGVDQSWGILAGATDYNPPDLPAPSFFVVPLWTKMGNIVLNVTNGDNARDSMSAWSHKKSDGTVQVILINKTGANRSETVAFTGGYNPTGKKIAIYELKAINGGALDWDVIYNGAASPDPSTADFACPTLVTCNAATYTRVLPPFSATVLDFGSTVTCGGSKTERVLERAVDPLKIAVTGNRITLRSEAGTLIGAQLFSPSGKKSALFTKDEAAGCWTLSDQKLAPGTYLVRIATDRGLAVRAVSLGSWR